MDITIRFGPNTIIFFVIVLKFRWVQKDDHKNMHGSNLNPHLSEWCADHIAVNYVVTVWSKVWWTVNTQRRSCMQWLSRIVGMTQEKVSSCFTECHAPETFASPLTCDHVAVVPLFWFFGTPRKLLLGVDSAPVLDNTRKQCNSRTLMQCSPSASSLPLGTVVMQRNEGEGAFLTTVAPLLLHFEMNEKSCCMHRMTLISDSSWDENIKEVNNRTKRIIFVWHFYPAHTQNQRGNATPTRLPQHSWDRGWGRPVTDPCLPSLSPCRPHLMKDQSHVCTLDHFTSGRTLDSAYCTALRKEGTLSRHCPSKGTGTERQR